VRARTFQRYLVDLARVQRRKDMLVLAPFFTERFFPFDVLFDAIATEKSVEKLAEKSGTDHASQARNLGKHGLSPLVVDPTVTAALQLI
jgi:hypothetical protein